jgi:hypothetical protein
VEYYNYLGSTITNYARCTRDIKFKDWHGKSSIQQEKTVFTSNWDLNLRKKLVNCYIRGLALYGAETWTLRKVDQKNLGSSEVWCWRRMEKISWTDRMRNEEVLRRVKEERNIPRKKGGRLI